MRPAVLLLIAVQLLAGQTLSVIHKKKLWRDGRGTIDVTQNGIVYRANKKKHGRNWNWLDIQHFDRISETEFVILTYEDQRRYLGRDRQYRFTITDGRLTDELFRIISRKLARPVTNRAVGEPLAVRYEVPVKHLHSLGGCEGTLKFTKNTIYFITDHKKDGREWQMTRDVSSAWSAHPYHLELHVYDNNRREFSRTRVYKFDLKKPLDPAFYRELKLSLYKLKSGR